MKLMSSNVTLRVPGMRAAGKVPLSFEPQNSTYETAVTPWLLPVRFVPYRFGDAEHEIVPALILGLPGDVAVLDGVVGAILERFECDGRGFARAVGVRDGPHPSTFLILEFPAASPFHRMRLKKTLSPF